MSRERYQRAKAIFAEACELPPEAQADCLDRACDGDAELRAAVEALLAADRTPAGALDEPAAEPFPDSIGGYRVRGVIGRGGMGIVYDAEQERPRRPVALKVMGVASPTLVRRFTYESEILGRLNHPGIAKVIEAGVADGQPYFAMERIDGVPLTRFAADLALDETLVLLAAVADAVQYAHRHGVIHRDLKPANILVERDGTPKLLDFGIAKRLDADATRATLATQADQLLGTLPYMSPEQFDGTADARCDVYALGVIAYEAIAGHTPKDFAGKTLEEAIALATTGDPPRLGAVCAAARGDVETIVMTALERDPERRYGSAGEFAADLRRTLRDEPITARPPSARYQLAKLARRHRALCTGLGIALAAIIAGGVTSFVLYLKKEEQRERAVLERQAADRERASAIAALAIAEARAETRDEVVAFLTGMFDVVDPAQARGRTVTVKEVLDAAARTIAGRLDTQPEVRSRLMLHIGVIYHRLGLRDRARPLLAQALEIRTTLYGPEDEEVATTLIAAAALASDDGDHERALALAERAHATGYDAATTLESLAAARHVAGDFAAAERTFREALAIDDRDSIRHGLAVVLHARGAFDDAARLAHAALARAIDAHGETHPVVVARRVAVASSLTAQGDLDAATDEMMRAIEAQSRLTGADSADLALLVNNLATIALKRGDLDGAREHFDRALVLHRRWNGEHHPDTIAVDANLGALAQQQGRLADAIEHYRRALRAQRALSGDRHPRTITYLAGIGTLQTQLRAFDDARATLQEAIALAREAHGDDAHPDFVTLLGHQATLARETSDLERARSLQTRALRMAREIWDDDTIEIAAIRDQLGRTLTARGDYAAARDALESALATYRAQLEPTAPNRIGCTASLANVAMALGDFVAADAHYAEALAAHDAASGPESEGSKRTLANLARLRQRQGDYARARPLFERLLADPPDDPIGHATIQSNFALNLLLLGDAARAEPLFRSARDRFRDVVGPRHPAIATLTHNVGECARLQGRTDDAAAAFRRALSIYEAVHGDEHPAIANTLTKLALATDDRPMLDRALAMRRKLLPKGHPDIAKTLVAMGDEASLAEAVRILRAAQPASPATAAAECAWALKLRDAGRTEEAVRLLTAALPTLERAYGTDHPSTTRAREALTATRRPK